MEVLENLQAEQRSGDHSVAEQIVAEVEAADPPKSIHRSSTSLDQSILRVLTHEPRTVGEIVDWLKMAQPRDSAIEVVSDRLESMYSASMLTRDDIESPDSDDPVHGYSSLHGSV